MIEEGINAVLCQHSHCPSGWEYYKDGLIVYGQGNFLFNQYPDPRMWLYEGYIVSFEFKNHDKFNWEIIPFYQSGKSPGVKKLVGEQKISFLQKIEQLSKGLNSPGFVETKWREHSKIKKNLYLGFMRGHNPIMRYINERFSLTDFVYSQEDLLTLLNVVRCQSHREMLVEILNAQLSRKI